MTSRSGNSSGSTRLQNSGSEGDMQVLIDQRKRKRMESNRESARRSRMRKQKHLDELMAQVSQLNKDNSEILTKTHNVTQHYLNIEAENSILRAQMNELSQRLQSLNDIIHYMDLNITTTTTNNNNDMFGTDNYFGTNPESFMNPWYLNQQPIMANSAAMFQY